MSPAEEVLDRERSDVAGPDVNYDYRIVYEDEWLLGINKPGNLRVHSRGMFSRANLIYHLRRVHVPPYPEASLINRLDADTSGVVLVARHKEALRLMAEQFRNQTVAKEYLAVVLGIPSEHEATISLPLGPVPGGKLKHRQGVREEGGGKTAVTRYRLQTSLGPGYALLRLQPETGNNNGNSNTS